jgi:hypothetical protein
MKPSEAFDTCTTMRTENSITHIDCKLGLWGVSGADCPMLVTEALYYWLQYYRDGEYDELLKESL